MSSIEEQLATAIVAKMAGMELKKVDDSTINQPSTGPATRIDPKQFLPGIQQHQQRQQEVAIAQINRQAEMMHPLPQLTPASANLQTTTVMSQPSLQTFTGQDPNQLTFDFLDEATTKKSLKQLDLIVDYLYSINNKLDKILTRDKHSVSK